MFDCGISKIIGDVVTSMEEENEKMIYKAVQSVGIDVDKKQLEKALFNAKSFYNDGYEDAKKKYERKWIPVSERYPNEEDEYKYFYVTDDKGEISIQKFLISLDKEHRPYFSGMVNVVAWMPLPEPYKAESEDKDADSN